MEPNGGKVHFLRKSALSGHLGSREAPKTTVIHLVLEPGRHLGPFYLKSVLFRTFAHLGRDQLRAAVFGPGLPPLRRATARGVGSIPLHGRSPSVPTHTHASVGVKPELIPFGAALRLLIPLTPTLQSSPLSGVHMLAPGK